MAFFKFRESGDEPSATPLLPDSLEVMRRRAKYRLIGAAVLVLVGVVGFPMLFDKQPRPISVDMPIDIPDRNKVKPLALPVPAKAEVAKPDASAASAVSAANMLPVPAVGALEPPKKATLPEPASAVKPAEKPLEKQQPVAKVDESSKVQALLDGHGIDKTNESIVGRYVVQVGAFAEVTKAREARLKLEHAGLKTYTHVAETKDGRRIRVRVGPFTTKAEAEKAAEKVKQLKLPAAILTL